MSESESGSVFSRRTLLRAASALAVAASPAAAQTSPEREAEDEKPPTPSTPPPPVAGSNTPQLFWTVDTSAGKVMGIAASEVKQFKGIPYGAPTGGVHRYMPPRRPRPWFGVRECFAHGSVSPQVLSSSTEYGRLIQWDQQPGGMGEDCLTLNVWTPTTDRSAKKAVLVCFHGGGWSTGSGNAPGFDGAMMARTHDVVVVTVNHRLSAFGYLNLIDVGAPPEFQYAGVCGVMDLTLALQWVRDNIEGFGGDRGRVMIFGQSGGGQKTSVMLGNPGAVGLFHRACVQSGSALRVATREAGAENAEKLLRALGLDKSNVAGIQRKCWQEILQATTAASAGGTPVSFSPVLDGKYLPHHPFDPGAPLESADIPVIISSTLHDAALSLTNWDLDAAGLRTIVARTYGEERADAIIAAQKAARPGDSNFLIQAAISTDAFRGSSVLVQAERKAALNRAPVYVYEWDWVSSMADGKMGAIHGLDVSAALDNARDVTLSGGTKAGQRISHRFAATWATFAKTGNPNNAEIPQWAPWTPDRRTVLVFDDQIRAVDDYRGALIRMLRPAT